MTLEQIETIEQATENNFKVIDSSGTYFELAKGNWKDYSTEFEVICFLNGAVLNRFRTMNIAGFINDKQDF